MVLLNVVTAMHTNPEPALLQNTFRALADPTRRQILRMLSERDMTIAEVSDHFEMTRAAVKKHLVVLYEGKVVSAQKQGREVVNRLEPMALKNIADWTNYFHQFWDARLADLQDAVKRDQQSKRTPK